MNRKDIYNKIKELKLEEEVKKVYGRNYTMVSSELLEVLIKKHNPKTTSSSTKEDVITKSSKLDKLIEVLSKKRILLKSEIEYINA